MEQEKRKTIKIVNQLGLHARAAALFVKTANRFKAEITVTKGKTSVNGKSIMGLLMLAAGQGSRIQISVKGPDAETALVKLEKLVVEGFHED